MYYIQEENEIKGPYNLEDLINSEIRRDSLIWKQGAKDWFPANKENSLKEYFLQRPPDLKKRVKVESSKKVKLSDRFWCFIIDAFLYESLAIIICLFIFDGLNIDIIINDPLLIILLLFLFLQIRVLIEALFVYFYGSSFMQKIAKIKVVNSRSEKAKLSTIIIRTFLKNIIIGIPTTIFYWFSDAEFLHEKLTNTQVKYEQL